MPVVVYHCISCGNTYNVLHRTWKEAEKYPLRCKNCGNKIRKIPQVCNFVIDVK